MDLDDEVAIGGLEAFSDCRAGAFHEFQGTDLAGTVLLVGVWDHDAQVDVGQRIEGVTVCDAAVDVDPGTGELHEQCRGDGSSPGSGFFEFVVGDLDPAASLVEQGF